MKSRSKLVMRIVLALTCSLLTLLVLEGALSLFTGRSLRSRTRDELPRFLRTDDEGFAAAAGSTGPYRVHKDPFVSYVLRYDTELQIDGARTVPDRLGMRVRPGPPEPEGAQRIIVLGDSVAFGTGLTDDQTIAAQLERVLARVRGPQVSPVACYTVAAPGWNHRNAVHFLQDHFQQYAPHIVVYLPIPNDLTDTLGVNESGNRRVAFDVGSADPMLLMNRENLLAYKYYFLQRIAKGEIKAEHTSGEVGPFACGSDLTAESSRRFDENVDSIVLLAELLSRNGAKLLLGHYVETSFPQEYAWILRERLLNLGLDIPEVPLLEAYAPELANAPDDPHPNPKGTGAIATWIARELIDRGWITAGAGNPFPEIPVEAATLRAERRSAETIRERARAARAECSSRLQSEVNLETGRGFDQIYGGLNPDGTISTRFLAMVKAEGKALFVDLEALPDAPHLYPLAIEVEINGVRAGKLEVPFEKDGATKREAIPLPERVVGGSAVEIRLIPERWVLHEYEGRSFVAACRIRSLACPPR